MEKLIEIIKEVVPGIDLDSCGPLVDGHVISSFGVLDLVSEIEEEFDIEVPPTELKPENFNTVDSIWALIERLQ